MASSSAADTFLGLRQGQLVRPLQRVAGVLSWTVVTCSLLGPLLVPVGILWFYAGFACYAIINSLKSVLFGMASLRRIARALTTDYRALYRQEARDANVLPWDAVVHAVIIPNYCEAMDILEETIEAVAIQPGAKNCVLVLAMEAKELAHEQKAKVLVERYGSRFMHMLCTVHPSNLPNEVQGKASNDAWAAARLYEFLQQQGVDIRNVVVTVADADSLLPHNYLASLTYHFAVEPQRLHRFWQGHITFFRNVYSVPPITGILDMLLTTDHLGWLSSWDMLVPLSTYSVSLHMLHRLGYWDTDFADEDFHLFAQAVIAAPDTDIKTVPLYLPLNLTSCQASTFRRTLTDRFDQARRHAMGARTIGWVMAAGLTIDSKGPWCRLLYRLMQVHVFGPGAVMALAVGWPVWQMLNTSYNYGADDFIVMGLLTFLRVIATAIGVCSLILTANFMFLKYTYQRKRPTMRDIIAWLCAPISTLIYIYTPILIAQTILFTQDNVAYKVTNKTGSAKNLENELIV